MPDNLEVEIEKILLHTVNYFKEETLKEPLTLTKLSVAEATQAIYNLVLDGKIKEVKELKELDEWFGEYGYEVHVSHVCRQDNIACAEFRGRTQKTQQIHQEVKQRIATLEKLRKPII